MIESEEENYIFTREKLSEILLGYKKFMALRCMELKNKGVNVKSLTYGTTEKLTQEFIDETIECMLIDSIINKY